MRRINEDRPLITRRGRTVYIPFVITTGADDEAQDIIDMLVENGWGDQAEAFASMHFLGEDSRPVG